MKSARTSPKPGSEPSSEKKSKKKPRRLSDIFFRIGFVLIAGRSLFQPTTRRRTSISFRKLTRRSTSSLETQSSATSANPVQMRIFPIGRNCISPQSGGTGLLNPGDSITSLITYERARRKRERATKNWLDNTQLSEMRQRLLESLSSTPTSCKRDAKHQYVYDWFNNPGERRRWFITPPTAYSVAFTQDGIGPPCVEIYQTGQWEQPIVSFYLARERGNTR